MRSVTYSMSTSLDGYIVGPDGKFDWSEPHEDIFRFATDEVRGLGVHLLGRHLYETMLYWEILDEDASRDESLLTFASLWTALPKVVFTRSLSTLQGNHHLATRSLRDEIEHWRNEPGVGDVAIGGASLAAQAAAQGLIDEYRVRVYPVLVGGGTSYFPEQERRENLELVETRNFDSGVVALRYRVAK